MGRTREGTSRNLMAVTPSATPAAQDTGGQSARASFLQGGGEMGALMRAKDWSTTPLGPVQSWSPALRTMTSILLANRFSMLLWWGPDCISIYNDAYIPVLGVKHPSALGLPVRECWSEIYDVLRPLIQTPLHGGPSTWSEDLELEIRRHGFLEETHWTVAYSSVPDETAANGIGGVLATVHEITAQVVGDRRSVLLRELGLRSTEAETAQQACATAATVFRRHAKDVPFALIYLVDPSGASATLASSVGVERDSPACASKVDLTKDDGPWSIAKAVRTEAAQLVDGIASRFPGLAAPSRELPVRALVLPIDSNLSHQPAGVLVLGLNPLAKVDASARAFAELATAQLAKTIANARITVERARAQAALRDSNTRLNKVLEVETVGVMFWDLTSGRMTDANDAFLNLMGYSRQELEAGELTWQRLTPPEYVDASLSEIRRFRESGRIGPYEKEYFHKDGTRQWLVFAGSSLGDNACVEFCVDISGRKAAEAALRKANLELAETDRRKNEFLAMLSHELRNPLAPISNSVFILERATPGGEQSRRAVSVIDRQVTHMTHLIDELLDITRISRGVIRLQRESLVLNDVVRGTCEDMRELFRRNGIALDIAIPDTPLKVRADRTRMAQVIGNLLQNAAKFTPSGGRATLTLQPSGDEAIIEVRDTGAGMDAGLLEKLFAPFMQADQTLDRSRGGLGLGLALVKGLMDLHGGKVSAASDGLGRGAAFTLRLPLEVAAQSQPEEAPRAAGPAHTLKVLVVEDNRDAAESLKEVLELDGHAVEMAFTGPEGVRMARAFRPDVVFCDIGLPEMDGYGVARLLREDPATSEALLIALSGYAAPEDIEKSREAGFDQHVAKPPSIESLQALLARKPGRREETPGSA